MSKMKSIAAMMALSALSGQSFIASGSGEELHTFEPLPKVPPKPKGLKLFNIDGVEVWAINEKNARRKAAKLGGIS